MNRFWLQVSHYITDQYLLDKGEAHNDILRKLRWVLKERGIGIFQRSNLIINCRFGSTSTGKEKHRKYQSQHFAKMGPSNPGGVLVDLITVFSYLDQCYIGQKRTKSLASTIWSSRNRKRMLRLSARVVQSICLACSEASHELALG